MLPLLSIVTHDLHKVQANKYSYLNVPQSLHNDAARKAIGTLDTPISASVETWSTHLPWNDIKQMQHLRNALSDEELCIRHMLQRPGVVPPSDVFHISFNVSASGGTKGLARIGCFTGDLRGGSDVWMYHRAASIRTNREISMHAHFDATLIVSK